MSYRAVGWRGFLLGVLAAGGVPPLTLLPLMLLALAGLLTVVGRARHSFVAGFAGLAFGIGYYMAGLYWITEAILVMADQFWWAVPIAVPLLSAVLALFIAVPCIVARSVPHGWRRVSALAGAWVLGDLARQFVLTGFPWNLLGSAWEIPGTLGLVFMQPACWVGVHGLTLATVVLAGSLTLGATGWATACALLGAWALAGYVHLQEAAPAPGLTAVLVQGNVSEAEHRDHGGERAWADRVFDRHLALTRRGVAQAQAQDPNRPVLVVWAETASPYALAQDKAARLAVADASAPAVMTLAGTERFESDSVAHNSLVAVGPGGAMAGFYDKSHLVPFGEYFPAYAHFLLGEQGFSPGPGLRTLSLPGLPKIGPLICYEAIFPARVVQPGARPSLLVNITNDAWFGDSAGPRQHLAAARMRAVEEGLPMLRAANTGISAVIDAHGHILANLGLDETGVVVSDIPGILPPTVAGHLGLGVPFLLAVIALTAARPLASRQKGLKIENNLSNCENFIDC